MLNCIIIGLGGSIGAISRYLMGFIPINANGFPFTTLLINFIGALLIGAFSTIPSFLPNSNPQLSLFLITGLCGGFTTFSTFSLEGLYLFESGKVTWGICYILLSVILCLAATFIGRFAARSIFS